MRPHVFDSFARVQTVTKPLRSHTIACIALGRRRPPHDDDDPPAIFALGPFFDAVSPARQEAPWPLRSLLLLPQCMVEAGPALRTSASAELAAQLGRDDCTFEGVCIRLQKTARWAAC